MTYLAKQSLARLITAFSQIMLIFLAVAANAGNWQHHGSLGNGHSASNEKKIVGYYTEWGVYARDYHVKNLHESGAAEKLTHIIYAFGNVKDGKCQLWDSYAATDKFYNAEDSVDGVSDTWADGALRGNFGQFLRLKAMYPDLKILWSFGGWTGSSGFTEAAKDPVAFADSCYDLVNDERWAGLFDGIDIDWEYPNSCGLTCDNSGFAAYRELMFRLRARFGDQLVTAAIPANEDKLNLADYVGAAEAVDFYMLMSYDFVTAGSTPDMTAPHSPLFAYPGIPNGRYTTDYAVNVLKQKQIPSNKILLGLGFYGRGWTGVEYPFAGAAATGPAKGKYEAGVNDYKELKETCPISGFIAGTAFAYCDENWWSYDTPLTILGKMHYLKSRGLGGAFFWELSGDTDEGELLNAIHMGLKPHGFYRF